MKKRFNVTGSCNPEWHYMVDNAKRFEAVEGINEIDSFSTRPYVGNDVSVGIEHY